MRKRKKRGLKVEQKCPQCGDVKIVLQSKLRMYCTNECFFASKKGKTNWWGYKIGNALRGKPKSPDHIENARKAHIGMKHPSMQGKKHPHWKGGVEITHGYRWIMCKEHPKNNKGKVVEHRLIMEKHLGRILESSEIVHHINGNKLDNRIENLEIVDRAQHMNMHRDKILHK